MVSSARAKDIALATQLIRELSVFDLDRTLTRWPTWSPFLLFAAKRHQPWRLIFTPFVVLLMLSYKLRLMSRQRLKENMQGLLLGNTLSSSRLLPLINQFARQSLSRNIFPEARKQIQAERDAGRHVAIASAAHEFYLRPIADGLGIDDVIATKSIWRDDSLSNRIDGANCYGVIKRDQCADFLSDQGLDRSDVHVRFFSDDVSDIPTFEWADEAVAVNPSKRLVAIALRRGWPVLDWR